MTTTFEPKRDRPRIWRFTIRTPDGHRASALVKAPLPEHDVADSVFGLNQRLTELTLDGRLFSFNLSVPRSIKHRPHRGQPCACFTRWPEALAAATGRLGWS